MSVNHAAEAQRLLSQASWMTSDKPSSGFVDPGKAAILAQLANAHATLAHLPEQHVAALDQLQDAQRDLATTRQVIGSAAAGAVLSGDRDRYATVWYLAAALDKRGVEVESPIREAIEQRGGDFEQLWVHPNTGLTDPTSPQGKAERGQLAQVLAVVVEQLIAMATSYEEPVRRRARQFMTALDGVGVAIDQRVDERSQELGYGPRMYSALGHDYDLTRQWFDSCGKRWEHTGGWSDVGGPVMRRDEPDGDSMVLSELIRERGPLSVAASPPKSPVRHDDPWSNAPF
jgi:hypothetical protein